MNINATLLAQAITFALFVWFCMKFIWPPLTGALANRKQVIADGLAAGERGKHELELAHKRASETLHESKGKASEIIAMAEKRAAQLIDEAKEAARGEAERVKTGAMAELDQQIHRAREQLRNQVAELAVVGAERILRREVNQAAHADLLDALKAEL